MRSKVNIFKLNKESRDDVGKIASDCFVDDSFFDYMSKSKTLKKEKLYSYYKKLFCLSLKHGETFGVFLNYKIVGFIMMLDYNKLKKNKNDYNIIFDLPEATDQDDIQLTVNYLNNSNNAEYLLAVCVSPEYQRRHFGSKLITYVTKYYKNNVVADVDNENSLKIYEKLNYKITKITPKFYIVDNKKTN